MVSFSSLRIGIVMVAIGLITTGCTTTLQDPAELTRKYELALCLTENGVTMYGTERCPHCRNQKDLFGKKAFAAINYIDCDANKTQCEKAGVTGFPTWIGSNNKKMEGEQTLAGLAESAGCTRDPNSSLGTGINTGS